MRYVWSLVFCVLALGSCHAAAAVNETGRIEYLIQSIEQLSGAKFIRNGAAYDAKPAADHLRLKWREAGTRVKTAEQFIELCASRSSVSGQPYRIRFADGTTVASGAFLRAKLKELDRPAR
jgi:hypothetical protein